MQRVPLVLDEMQGPTKVIIVNRAGDAGL
jgi:hypothetical protein